MALCGSPRACQSAIRSADIGTAAEINGTYPTIEFLGDGSAASPWQPRLNVAWANAILAAVSPVPWIPITTFSAGWANFGAPYANGAYRKVGDMVQMRGLISRAAAVSGQTMFTLPVGYRPVAIAPDATSIYIFPANHDTVLHGRTDVYSDGRVICQFASGTASYWSIDISFSTRPGY